MDSSKSRLLISGFEPGVYEKPTLSIWISVPRSSRAATGMVNLTLYSFSGAGPLCSSATRSLAWC